MCPARESKSWNLCPLLEGKCLLQSSVKKVFARVGGGLKMFFSENWKKQCLWVIGQKCTNVTWQLEYLVSDLAVGIPRVWQGATFHFNRKVWHWYFLKGNFAFEKEPGSYETMKNLIPFILSQDVCYCTHICCIFPFYWQSFIGTLIICSLSKEYKFGIMKYFSKWYSDALFKGTASSWPEPDFQ